MAKKVWIPFSEVPIGSTYGVRGEFGDLHVRVSAQEETFQDWYVDNKGVVERVLWKYPTRELFLKDREAWMTESKKSRKDSLILLEASSCWTGPTTGMLHPVPTGTEAEKKHYYVVRENSK